jgi:hypothetical protein
MGPLAPLARTPPAPRPAEPSVGLCYIDFPRTRP